LKPTRERHVPQPAEYIKFYMKLPAYQKNLGALGFDQTDLANGGSDRLVDAVVAWGDEAKLRARVQAHYTAGARVKWAPI
jgi:hypothetical protein